jgi:peptide/nickel transport system substrate-binding protein
MAVVLRDSVVPVSSSRLLISAPADGNRRALLSGMTDWGPTRVSAASRRRDEGVVAVGGAGKLRIVAVALAVFATACSNSSSTSTPSRRRLDDCPTAPATCNSGERKAGGQITWVVEQPWGDQWNAMRAEGASFYLGQMLAGTTPDVGDFQPSGKWASNLDLLVSEPKLVKADPQTMQYVLRPEAVWSDGTPISADDFRFNWFHNSGRPDQCEGCDPADTTGWADIASIESSGQTVTLTLKAGVHDPEWFAGFGPSAYPAHVATKAGFDWHTPKGMGAASAYFRNTVPTWSGGPYLIDSVVKDQRVILVPNPRWYGKERPTLTRVVKEVLTNQAAWPAAVANGELDGGAPLSYDPDVAKQLRSTPGVSSALGASGASWEQVALNLRTPTLADLALRKAIFTALDIKDLRARLYGDVKPVLRTNPIFTPQSPYDKDVLTSTGYGTGDLTTARKLLSDAGYTGAAPGQHLTKQGAAVPDLRFAFIAGHPTRGPFVEIAQQRLSEIGITVKPVAVPGTNFGRARRDGDFDITIYGLNSGPLFTFAASSFFTTGSNVNFPGVSDPALDREAGAVLEETDVAAAAAHANAVASRLMAVAAVLPLWDTPTYVFVRDRYVNVRDNPLSQQRAMYDMAAWGESATR